MQKTIGFDSCPADTFLLAAFAARHPGESGLPRRVIDLGCGPGRLLYEFGLLHPQAELFGLEVNRNVLELAASALMENGLRVQVEERLTSGPGIHLIHGDVRETQAIFTAGFFDAVFLNPPYFCQGEGRLPEDPLRASFRHEQGATVKDFFQASAYLVHPSGAVHAIYPASRKNRLLEALEESGLALSLLRDVYPGPAYSEPRWSLFQMIHRDAWKETIILEPVHDPDSFMGYERERQAAI